MTHVAIAGAGIAGLSAAVALAREGVKVTILERRHILDEVGAGLQLSPNATRWLAKVDLLPALLCVATRPDAVRIRRGHDGREIVRMPLGDIAHRRYGAPFLALHRADLQRVLADRVGTLANVDLKLGVAVESVVDRDRVIVQANTTAGTAVVEADGFVDAGGLHSATRPPSQVSTRSTKRLAWRALVPSERVAPTFAQAQSNLWLGPHAHLVHYPVRGGSLVNVIAVTEASTRFAAGDDLWSRPGEATRLRKHFASWHDEALALIGAAPGWRVWPLFEGTGHRAWRSGTCTVVGDAAHPMLPFLAQGASQAIEDAAALGEAVATDPGDLRTAFQTYEDARRSTAERVQAASRRQGQIYHLAGPAALARDAAMRLLGPQRMLARMDWIYRGPPHGVRSSDTIP